MCVCVCVCVCVCALPLLYVKHQFLGAEFFWSGLMNPGGHTHSLVKLIVAAVSSLVPGQAVSTALLFAFLSWPFAEHYNLFEVVD